MFIIKRMISDVAKDVGKLENLYTAGGEVKITYLLWRKQLGSYSMI